MGQQQKVQQDLSELSREMSTQDSHVPSNPIYIVQQRRRIYGIDPKIAGANFVWLDLRQDGARVDADTERRLEEEYQETFACPEEYYRTGFVDRWDFVQPFFTRRGATEFIEDNATWLVDPRIVVNSARRNHEWRTVRQVILSVQVGGNAPVEVSVTETQHVEQIPEDVALRAIHDLRDLSQRLVGVAKEVPEAQLQIYSFVLDQIAETRRR